VSEVVLPDLGIHDWMDVVADIVEWQAAGGSSEAAYNLDNPDEPLEISNEDAPSQEE